MSLSYYVDHVWASKGWRKGAFTVLRGAELAVEGWAFDRELGVPNRVEVLIDDRPLGIGGCSLDRADVAERFGLPSMALCGFRVVLQTDDLGEGSHTIVLRFGFEDGSEAETPAAVLEIYSSDVHLPAKTERPRVIVAAAPKSGSSYAVNVLLAYYGIANPFFRYVYTHEHTITERLIVDLGDRPFVIQLHMLPRVLHLEIMRAIAVAPVVTWRNLADTVISYDDHVRTEGAESAAGTFTYVGDRAKYLSLDDQTRYRFLIRHMVPWCIGFFLGWRAVRAPIFARYEQLVDDPFAYFSAIIEPLSGTPDEARLRKILSARIPNTRFNVGINGRARHLMNDETKALLESMLREHYDDLGELVDELPWRAGAPTAKA